MTKIKGFEGYEVNENGEIFSLPKKTRKGIRKIKPIQHPKTGYMYVDLCNNGKIKKFTVHRLIAMTLIPNPENKPQVNHINGIKTDNRPSNLEWSTRSENQLHSIRYGLRTTIGEKNSQCKLSEKEAYEIKYSKQKTIDLSKKYKISQSTICDIRKGRSWTHI